ncbi:class I SAM-dependent methyltransferase [Variovorax humicola]|uniref:Class I SAM-dependent methyltransferase n=1 Tax=Variovorax humicola TaxID=1769758 RepID=A0ABU8VWN8_9BURK
MAYYSNVNTTILDLIGAEVQSICEFGCGAGALAEAVKIKNPTVFYVGIDIAAEPLRDAARFLDVAIQCNVDTYPHWDDHPQMKEAIPPNHFDCIVFGDVLEHLYAPEIAVQQAVARLKPGGVLIACIPNVQHWSVFVQLVSGSWPRHDEGLFDRTHIRWFALSDMCLLLQNEGLSVEKVVPRVFNEPAGREILEFLEPLAQHLHQEPEQFVSMSLPLQYVLVGRKVN